MRTLLLALLCAAGCAHIPLATPAERDAITATVEGWREAGLPAPEASCGLDRLYVVRPDAQEFERRCHAPVSAAASCLDYDRHKRGLVDLDVPVVVIAPGWPDERGAVVHEALHLLVRCVLRRGFWDPYDARHADPRVWKEAGGDTSAQGQVR